MAETIFTQILKKIKLSIVICALNEEKTLPSVLKRCLALGVNKEIIVVDDGSSDKTADIATSLSQEHSEVVVLRHDAPRGKGGALRSAISYARGEFLAIQDADLEYEPVYINEALRLMEERALDAVFGSRFLRKNPTHYPLYLAGNKLVSFFVSFLTGTKITDAYTGTKVFKTELIKKLALEASGFDIEAEMAVKIGELAKEGKIKFGEIPISYHPRTKKEGKKISIKDGLAAFWSALKTWAR